MPDQLDIISKGDDDTTPDLTAVSPEVAEYISKLEAANADLATALEDAVSKGDDEDDGEDGEDGDADLSDLSDDLAKLLGDDAEDSAISKADPEVKELVAKMLDHMGTLAEKVTNAESVAKAEKDARLIGEWISKAEAFEAIPGVKADTFGPVLKSMADQLDTDTMDVVTKVLTAANGAIEAGGLTHETGTGGDSRFEGLGDLEKAASALIAKGDETDPILALAKAVTDNPSLYADARKGRA